MHSRKGELFYTKDWAQSHLDHHKEVNNKNEINYTKPEGLIFGWFPTSVLMVVMFIIPFYFINRIANTDLSFGLIILLSIISALLYGMLWNTFHAAFHNTAFSYDISVGFPSFHLPDMFKQNYFVSWLWRNHAYHHLNKGDKKGNFNIILPGADHIMGTYRDRIDNTEYCKNLKPEEKDEKMINICKYPPLMIDLAKRTNFSL